MISNVVSENLRTIIARKGLKNKAVAHRAGFSEKQFSALLHGRKTMKDIHIAALANALEVTPNELFGVADATSGDGRTKEPG